jgi:hypothetical protein
MNYLYGDSTPSTLKSNFLEFLRDAIDFSVFALQADDRIRRGREHMEALRQEAAAENERLRVFVGSVSRAIAEAPVGEADKPTAACAAQLASRCEEGLQAFLQAVQAKLDSDIGAAEAKEAAERAACVRALEALLLPHEPPDATSIVELALDPAGVYAAAGRGEAGFGLAWRFDLAVPAAHFWSTPVRVERLAPQLEIRAPQLSGWISKEIKIKQQRLERFLVTELTDDGEMLAFKLRPDPVARTGFDVEVNTAASSLSIARVADDAKDAAATGVFDLDADDTAKILELGVKLRASIAGLERKGVAAAALDGLAFESLPTFQDLVGRLVDMMAPITREIATRSLTPNELVLRRMLGNDRREEIFVTKASLREKYVGLPDALRARFGPLALDAVTLAAKVEPSREPSLPTTRQELPASRPPPPPEPAQAAPEIAIPKPPSTPDLAEAPPPESAVMSSPDVRKVKEDVIATLKRNIALIREGKVDDGYRGFESFFSSDTFASFRSDDQRQALGVMVLGKTPPHATDAVIDAHLSAIACLQRLVETSNHALDYEMLGVCHQVIEDTETAAKMFARALEIERANNPQSELCGRLMKRASSV